MGVILLVYIIGPLLASWVLITALKRWSSHEIAPHIREIFVRHPIEKGFFRVLKSDHKGTTLIADFETKMDAVDCAYREKEKSQASREAAAFFVLNDQAETLEETDADV